MKLNYTEEIQWVDIAGLEFHPCRLLYRSAPNQEEINHIAGNILLVGGIEHPIKVQVQPGTDRRIIIGGHTRVEAALRLGWEQVPAIFFEVNDEEAERMLVEDNQNRNQGEKDLIRVARIWLREVAMYGADRAGRPQKGRESETQTAIAKRHDVSRRTLLRTIHLLRLIPEWQVAVSQGKMKLYAGNAIAALPADRQRDFYISNAAKLKSDGYTISQRIAETYRDTCLGADAHRDEDLSDIDANQADLYWAEMRQYFFEKTDRESEKQDKNASGTIAQEAEPEAADLFLDDDDEALADIDFDESDETGSVSRVDLRENQNDRQSLREEKEADAKGMTTQLGRKLREIDGEFAAEHGLDVRGESIVNENKRSDIQRAAASCKTPEEEQNTIEGEMKKELVVQFQTLATMQSNLNAVFLARRIVMSDKILRDLEKLRSEQERSANSTQALIKTLTEDDEWSDWTEAMKEEMPDVDRDSDGGPEPATDHSLV